MFKELDVVVLNHDLPAHGLVAGDVGAIVACYRDGKWYEVEFVTADGETLAVLTMTDADIRPIAKTEILHARALTLA
jgi:hypothetical protein